MDYVRIHLLPSVSRVLLEADSPLLFGIAKEFQRPKQRYSKAARKYVTVGWHYGVNRKTGAFKTGFLDHVLRYLLKHGRAVEVRNKRGNIDRIGPGPVTSKARKEFIGRVMRHASGIGKHEVVVPAGVQPRDYQIETVKRTIANPRGLWDISTGGGKTVCALMLVQSLPEMRFLISAPIQRTVLIDQGAKSFRRFGQPCGIVQAGDFIKDRIVWASAATLLSRLKNPDTREYTVKWLQTFDGFIRDEIHEMAESEHELYTHLTAWLRIGMSGTPFGDDAIANMRVLDLFGSKLITVDNQQLKEGGYIADPYIYAFEVQHKHDVPRQIGAEYHLYTAWLSSLLWRNMLICSIAKHLDQKGYRVAVISNRIDDHVLPLVSLLERRFSLSAEAYIGDVDKEDRKPILDRFSAGETRVIVGSRIFDTGVSEDAVSAIILASGSRKTAIQLQRLGRGLRLDGKLNRVVLVDLMDTCKFGRGQAVARLKAWRSDPAFTVRKVKSMQALADQMEQDGL